MDITKITYIGIKNGKPLFDVGERAPPKWLIDAIAPVDAGGNVLKSRRVLYVQDDTLRTKTRTFEPGDVIQESDLEGRYVREPAMPERYSAEDKGFSGPLAALGAGPAFSSDEKP
jgi:hypothetical protein